MKFISHILEAARRKQSNHPCPSLPKEGSLGPCAVLRHFLDVSLSPSANRGFIEASGPETNRRDAETQRRTENKKTVKNRFFAAQAILAVVFTLLLVPAAFSATIIENTAKAAYSVASSPAISYSNKVVTAVRTTATLEYLKYAPNSSASEMVSVSTTNYLDSTGSYVSMPDPVPVGSTSAMDMSNPIPLITAAVYHETEPIFLRLTDGDQNIDPLVAETVVLTLDINKNGEKETLVLTETGLDTGIFVGYIQSVIGSTTPGSADINNGKLSVYEDAKILATYEDDQDGITTYEATALVDPFGVVFDTSNGQPVNGATVTLMDMITGQPAAVFGDDGVSIYPSTVTTGATAVDSSGVVYTFSPGGYRFPFISPGRYRLDVVPPAAYRSPSTVSTADIQNLPGAPFAIVEPGSRGEEFYINPGPAIHIDLPADPIPTSLYVTKAAGKSAISIGDFLQYKVTVENTAAIAVNSIQVADTLPLGFRYRKGSAKINGFAAPEPSVSTDGRTLAFSVGTLAVGGKAEITYVVNISAGATVGKGVNLAAATGSGGAVSNTARAEVLVKDELFGGQSLIMGRVFPNGCGDGQDIDGVSGIRIYLEDGTYVVTDKKGMYHFEGLKSGTHVVQLDLVTLPEDYELISCEENDRFAGTPYSQFVDLQGGTMWRADFYALQKPKALSGTPAPSADIIGLVGIELSSVLAFTPALSQGDRVNGEVDYELSLHVGDVPVNNLRASVILPEGVEYREGTSSLGDAALPDPEIMGNTITYRINEEKEGWDGKLRLSATVVPDGKDGDLTTKAILTFDSSEGKNKRTPLAENILHRKIRERKAVPDIVLHPHFDVIKAGLKKEDLAVLDGIISELKKARVIEIHVTGHTDSTRIAPRSRHIFADNYVLSIARAKSVADYLAMGLGLSPSQMVIEGKGPDEPISNNKTVEGRALNRRVELDVYKDIGTLLELKNEKDKSGLKEVEIKVVNVVEVSTAKKEERIKPRSMPEIDNALLDSIEPGFGWVWPYEGYYPPIPSTKIAVKHDPGKRIELFLNGERVNPIYFETTLKRKDEKVAMSLWIGLHLKEGDNLFEAVEDDTNGSEAGRIRCTIHYSGTPVKAELVLEKSRLIADGKTPAVLAVRFTDKDGHPVSEGAIGEYSVAPPYTPRRKAEELQNDPLTMSKKEKLQYKVSEDGTALIELDPTSKTGEAVLRFNLINGENEVRAWLAPEEREWILVGLAEGTMGYNTVSGNMESLGGSDVEDKYYKDGRLAFFAKGMIKGKWLLTMAYGSDKKGIRNNDSLHGTIDPDKYYMLYGDATQQGYEAASARALYVKIERDGFYALLGDYDTGLTVTELSRYSRNFNGFKSEMKGDRLDFKLFASDTNQAFVKDEIRGDGTSGLYKLSRKNIVLNSESVTIETRDRFRSEAITSSQKLTRHIDYSIDYEAGTIYFKSPVYSRDENFNPIYIVVDYESYDPTDMSFNYGGRGAARFLENKLEIGATHVHEGRIGGKGDMLGTDAAFQLDDKTKLRAEFAQTNTDFNNVSSNGNAYLAELSHRSEKVEGKVYVRGQEKDFGLGQQNGSESGTKKMGFDGTYRLDERLSIRTEAFRQYNLATEAIRDMAEVQARYSEKQYELHAGLRHAEDAFDNGAVNSSEQVSAGGSFRMLNDNLVLRVEHDQSLIRSNENSDFPTRTIMGADYKLNETATFFIAQEFTQGENEDTETTRIGLKASPWNGGQISSTLEQQYTENGARIFSVTGLKQTWHVTKKWSVDAGLDRSETLKHPGNNSLNTNVPAASGGADFTAASLGAAYKEEKWGWTGRIERRESDNEEKTGLFTGVYGDVREGVALAAAIQVFITDSETTDKKSGDLRFGLAYRPKETNWIVLDHLDYLFDEQKGSGFDYDNWRVINNLNMNYKANKKTQLSLQYGAKYVAETIDDRDYSGYTDLSGLEGRYDITKKWDIGLRGNVLHSWEVGQYKYGYGPSAGYNFAKNIWLSVGYNLEGFRDRDFSRADFTSEGPYVKFRMKFDQGTAKDAVKWFTGQQ